MRHTNKNKTRVLVTGATGFIGRAVLQRLGTENAEIHAVSTQQTEDYQDHSFFHQADLLDSDQVAGLLQQIQPSHLVHLAWELPRRVHDSSRHFSWVRASFELVRKFRENGGQRVVVAGSCFEYDPLCGYCTEQYSPIHPGTVYGQAKDILHQWIASYAGVSGLSLAWARIFYVYGPYEASTRLVPSVTQALINDQPALCSHGEQVRDYLHVSDVASACVALLYSDVQGAINIASGDPVRLREIIHFIATELDRLELVRLGALDPDPSEPDLIVGNTKRLRDEVGWNPTFSLDAGLRQTITWWQKQYDSTTNSDTISI